ncbi:MAG: asparaginase domain-containing protein [Patescibacteria group bacterium]|nr:asparaginase domain-containing protein [Patescibacteria group bacterium]
MAIKRPKICLLFCGGTTLISRNDKTTEVHAKSDIKPWLDDVPELAVISSIEPIFVFGGAAESVSPEIWTTLAKEIKKNYSAYDGFVITHDFDSIVYTGAALSFMLQNLGKPIVLTGSQDSPGLPVKGSQKVFDSFLRLGIRANLINAVQVATMDLAEVSIMYGNHLLRATQTRKTPSETQSLAEATGEGLGKADFGIKLSEEHQRRRRTAVIVHPELEPNVFSLHLHPGMNLKSGLDLLGPGVKGLLIRATDVALKTPDYQFLERFASQRRLPVFLSQMTEAKGPKLPHLIELPSMLPEVALVKVMWALGQTKSLTQLRELVNENLANEFLKPLEEGK